MRHMDWQPPQYTTKVLNSENKGAPSPANRKNGDVQPNGMAMQEYSSGYDRNVKIDRDSDN